MWLNRWRDLLRRLGLVLGIYFLLRVLFLVVHRGAFADVPAGGIARAFLHGLRFDLSAVLMINALFVFLSFLPPRPAPPLGWQRFVQAVFLLLNFPFLIVNVIDLEYYKFLGRRSTVGFFGMATDAGVKWSTMLSYYWPLVLLGLALLAALILFYGQPRVLPPEANRPSVWWLGLLNCALAAGLTVLAIRGGWQLKSLSPAQAMVLRHSGLGALALNSSFTLIKSHDKRQLKRQAFYPAWDEVIARLRPTVDGPVPTNLPPRHDNVLVIIIESLAAEYCGFENGGPRYTPFLDTLAQASLVFPNHYANGRRSIEVMSSVLAGLPSLMDEAWTESVYRDNRLLGLGKLLSEHGYTTSFFHGAHKGSMRFDLFMELAGMTNYVGLAEYPGKGDFDGNWGIFDEPFLQFTAQELTRQKAPFAAAVFTLTSHHPYTVPAQHAGRFPEGTLPIHRTVRYVDYALEQFFATARQQPWYSNTLFIITADHTQQLEHPTPLGTYRVPLLLFHPRGRVTGMDTNRVTQHVDVFPTLLDYLGVAAPERLLFGRSLLRGGEGRAFLNASGTFYLVRGDRVLKFIPGQLAELYDPQRDPRLLAPIEDEPQRRAALEAEAKALLQYFNNGALDNRLYDRSPPRE